MNISLCPTFSKSLSRLSAQEQALVKTTVMDFMMTPEASGHRLHPLSTREKRFHSISPNMDLRIIALRDGGRLVMMYVDHHDQAYRWAERRKVEKHPMTGSAQLVEFEEVVREEVRFVPREVPKPPLFGAEDDGYLLSLGVPPVYLPYVKEVDEDGLLDLCLRLPEEAREALLTLATGMRPAPTAVADVDDLLSDPFEHPDARRRFWVASDEDALAQALERPWDEWLVFLHPSQREAVERNFNGPCRISGSAGTGKTVVAMHRAALLAREMRAGRLLLTTFSSTLASRLADGMDNLLGPASTARGRVHVTHLHQYAHEMVTDGSDHDLTMASHGDIRDMLARHRTMVEDAPPLSFLAAEWNTVIDYWGLTTWADYRDVSRAGRGGSLSPRCRQQIWPIFEAMREEMRERRMMTWGDLCDRARVLIEEQGSRPFRHVVVDEAQDLGPRELRLAAALAPAGPRAFTFTGDSGQTIYRYPFPWIAAGIDVRGRSRRLKVNYRTSEQIRRFSDRLLPHLVAEVDGEAEDRRTVSLLTGPEPEVKAASSTEDEVALLVEWLSGLVARGVAPEQIGIFGRTREVLRTTAIPAVEGAGLSHEILSPDIDAADGAVSIGTMHAAKGLEFRAVALTGCSSRHLPLPAALAGADTADARAVVLDQERHLLYVGCTRAREALLITYCGSPSPFL